MGKSAMGLYVADIVMNTLQKKIPSLIAEEGIFSFLLT
jgi:hypothetical protein